jgi:hypothetical protein
MSKRRPYQFSIGRLLALSTVVALSLAVAGWLTSTPAGQALAGTYFGLLAAWVVMRWPAVRDNLREVRLRRQKILEERATMVADANRTRPGSTTSSSDTSKTEITTP